MAPPTGTAGPRGAPPGLMGRVAHFLLHDTTVDGLRMWLVVLGVFLALVPSLGFVYVTGIFLNPIVREWNVTQADASLVSTLNVGFFYLGGGIATPASDVVGVRPIIFAGISLWVLGIVLASYAESLGAMQGTMGVVAGLGSALVMWPSLSVVPQWSNRYRSTAVSLGALGAGVGNLVLAESGVVLMAEIGWRGTLRVFAGIGAVCACLAIVLVERRLPRVKGGLLGAYRASWRLLRTDRSFGVFLLACFIFQFAFLVPNVQMDTYALSLGYDASFAGLVTAMLGVGTCVGRIVLGPLGDVVGRFNVFHVSVVASAVCLFTLASATSEGGLLAWCILYPTFSGTVIAIFPVVIGNQWGLQFIGPGVAAVALAMTPGGMAAGTLAGLAFDAGSFAPAFYACAGAMTLSALLFLTLREKRAPPKPQAPQAPALTVATPSPQSSKDVDAGRAPTTSPTHGVRLQRGSDASKARPVDGTPPPPHDADDASGSDSMAMV